MKRILLFVGALVVFAQAAMAGGSCGDSQRVASLLHEVVYADDRADAESRLISGIFPISTCLSREGYVLTPTTPGKFGIVLHILGSLRRQNVHMSTPEDVDRKLRLWQLSMKAK